MSSWFLRGRAPLPDIVYLERGLGPGIYLEGGLGPASLNGELATLVGPGLVGNHLPQTTRMLVHPPLRLPTVKSQEFVYI